MRQLYNDLNSGDSRDTGRIRQLAIVGRVDREFKPKTSKSSGSVGQLSVGWANLGVGRWSGGAISRVRLDRRRVYLCVVVFRKRDGGSKRK